MEYTWFADLVDSRKEGLVNTLVCVLIHEGHWTLHVHDIAASEAIVTSWNSLSGCPDIDLTSQLHVASRLRELRRWRDSPAPDARQQV